MLIRRLIAWLTLSDYDEARTGATLEIVGHYSRGNVNVQGGRIMREPDLQTQSLRADASMRR